MLASPFSTNFHNSLLKRTVHTAYKASSKVYIKIPPANPKFLPSGKPFPSLRKLYSDAREDDRYTHDFPRLSLWQTSEACEPYDTPEVLTEVADYATALPSIITDD